MATTRSRLREIPARIAAAAREETDATPTENAIAPPQNKKGKKKRHCNNCKQDHYPPTGKKCALMQPPPQDPPAQEHRDLPAVEVREPPVMQQGSQLTEKNRPEDQAPGMAQFAELTQTLKGFMSVITQQLPQLQSTQPPGPAPEPTVVRPREAPAPVPSVTGPSPGCPQTNPGVAPPYAPVPHQHPSNTQYAPVVQPPQQQPSNTPYAPAAQPFPSQQPSNTQYAPAAQPSQQPSNTQYAPAAQFPPSNTLYAPATHVQPGYQAPGPARAPQPDYGDQSDGSSESDADDEPGASAKRIRGDRPLQHQIQHRITEFSLPHEQPSHSNGKGKKQTGKNKTAADVVEVDVDVYWPHLHVRGPGGEPLNYESLTFPLFVQGYTQVMRDTKDKKIRSLMLAHLQELAMDASTFPWEWVRGFHAAVLTDMERGKCTWGTHRRIQTIRHREIEMRSIARTNPQVLAPLTATQPQTAIIAAPKPVSITTNDHSVKSLQICVPYQSGQCSQKYDHDGLKHLCQFCWENYFNKHKHASAVCNKKHGRKINKKQQPKSKN